MTSTAGGASHRIRMAPEDRRTQLLEHGVRLLSTRSLDELSIEVLAEEAGISRGLLYHYFGTKQEFHEAVVRQAVHDLVAITAPDGGADLVEVLTGSLEAYVDYVVENRRGYQSLVRAAAGGNVELRRLYEEARHSLTDRLLNDGGVERAGVEGLASMGYDDTPAVRLMVRGWSALAETVVLSWAEDDHRMTKPELLTALVGSLFGVLDAAR